MDNWIFKGKWAWGDLIVFLLLEHNLNNFFYSEFLKLTLKNLKGPLLRLY